MESIAYIKYEGANVHEGVFGILDSVHALMGVNKALRYYVEKDIPELKKVSYDFPVEIRRGSWEMSIPEAIESLMQVVQNHYGTLALLEIGIYLRKVFEKAGEEGFLETGPAKDIRKITIAAVEKIQWVIKYVKHMQGFNREPRIKFSNNNESITVFNNEGKPLSLPASLIDVILRCPKDLIDDMVKPVKADCTLRIAVRKGDHWDEEIISDADRELFYAETEELDELPEMVDGDIVTIEGLVVRANEKEQSFGLQYKNHVITCKPEEGKSLASFKAGLISSSLGKLYQKDVKVTALIERVNADGKYKTRPRLFVSEVTPMLTDGTISQMTLI